MKTYKDKKGKYERVYLQQYINDAIEMSKYFNDEVFASMLVNHKTKQFIKDYGKDGFFKRYIIEPMSELEKESFFADL